MSAQILESRIIEFLKANVGSNNTLTMKENIARKQYAVMRPAAG